MTCNLLLFCVLRGDWVGGVQTGMSTAKHVAVFASCPQHTHLHPLVVWPTPLAAVARRKARLDSLRAEHGPAVEADEAGSAWALGSAEFRLGVAELCLFKVQALQASLATLSGKYVFTKLLQQKVGSARKQHPALDRQLDRHRAKIKEEVQQLLAWVAELRARLQLLSADAGHADVLARAGIATAAGAAGALTIHVDMHVCVCAHVSVCPSAAVLVVCGCLFWFTALSR